MKSVFSLPVVAYFLCVAAIFYALEAISSRIRKNKLIKKINASTALKEKRKITQKRLDPTLYF